MTILYHSYLHKDKTGKYFSVLCNARQEDKVIFRTKSFRRKHLALREIQEFPILPEKILFFDDVSIVV